MSNNNPIGLFDSGMGGLSVWREIRAALPAESLIFFGDGVRCPYGSRPESQVLQFTVEAVERLIAEGCKLIVIACNTATAVAIDYLRERYADIPFVGLEPAIKPAIKTYPKGKILVLATPVTLSHEKFQNLLDAVGRKHFVLMPAPRLVEYVENGFANREEVIYYLRELLRRFNEVKFDACVLGCTHFPFVKNEISDALGYTPSFFDGAQGTASCLKNTLLRLGLLNENNSIPLIAWNTKYDNNLQNRLLYNKI
jgi:glutamate racemase